jgi:site-specific recombinase XerD
LIGAAISAWPAGALVLAYESLMLIVRRSATVPTAKPATVPAAAKASTPDNDLRHTHATILLLLKVPVHVVSQRLGHASPVITMSVYAHVLPGSQREAAELFAKAV